MSKPNFEIEDKTGKKYWISRSIVVAPVVLIVSGNTIYTLIEKRGNAVSNTGKWCVPCGYLDWDETLEDACIREIKEETGVNINPSDVFFIGCNSEPSESRQNVSMRFCCFASPYDVSINVSNFTPNDEVDELRWIRVGWFERNNVIKVDNESIGDYNWAFNHNELIITVLDKFYGNNFNIML